MVILGLTGSIGTGKSTTAKIFRGYGIPVYDADKTVHQLYQNPEQTPIAQAFPSAIRDGQVDRTALKAILADDASKLTLLEMIIHPIIQQIEKKMRQKLESEGHRLMVLDIPLLFETGAEKRCDLVLVTHVNETEQKHRVLARSGMKEDDFYRLLARQMPQIQKCRLAHLCLNTGLGIEHAKREVSNILRSLSGIMRPSKGY